MSRTLYSNSDPRQCYFFLSYAHSPPLAGSRLTTPNAHVRMFFDDLSKAVRRHAGQSGLAIGYFDREMPFNLDDRKAALELAIGAAEVFVPLCSPSYVAKSWPGREWACFEQRMRAAGVPGPLQRFAPVRWIPLPPNQQEPPGLRQFDHMIPSDVAHVYVENGLLALMRLAPYRSSYELVVDRLAAHIVKMAESAPVGSSVVPDISQVRSVFSPGSDVAVFVVAVAAPALHEAPDGSNRLAYGASASAWRPFTREELSLADHAAIEAEQLDFAVKVMDIDKAGDVFSRAPGVMLIDPWYIADGRRLEIFRQKVLGLPGWVLPVLVPDLRAGGCTVVLEENIRKLFGGTNFRSARQGLRGIGSLTDFVTLMPFLVVEAEREYLWHGPIQRTMAAPSQSSRGNVIAAVSVIPSTRMRGSLPGHAFISYVREDSVKVAQLQALLEAAGVPVWRDTADLWPGEDWRLKIRRAITNDALVFLVCFSANSLVRDKSYQNEELVLAVEQMLLRRPEDTWLIPIRFDDCNIPDRDIGGGRTLQSIQCADLFGDRYYEDASRLVAAIQRILGQR